MSTKSTVYLSMAVGSSIGGFIPLLWGANYFSFSSVIFTAIGGIAGVWIAYKLSRW